MSALIEKLNGVAKSNFCEDCYQKYLDLIQGEIEFLLSEPMSDWRQVESNINDIVMKALGFVKKRMDSTAVSLYIEGFIRKVAKERWTFKSKLQFLRQQDVIGESLYNFLDKVREIRNNIHPPSKFSEKDYSLFKEAKELTNLISSIILFDLKGVWERELTIVEKHAKQLLEDNKLI